MLNWGERDGGYFQSNLVCHFGAEFLYSFVGKLVFFFFQSKYFFLTPFHFPLFFPNKFHSNFSFLKEFYGLLVLVKDIQHAFISFFLSYLTRLIASSHVIETLSLFLNYYISCLFTTKIVIQTCKLIVKNI